MSTEEVNHQRDMEETEDVLAEELSFRSPDMSVGSQTFPPGGPNGILRSQSFAGFSGIPERRSRCNSFLGNASVPKKPQAKQKKSHNLGHKNSSSSKEPQPERLEEIYGALKTGLDEYLEVHQTELDKLTAQLKDMRRNSRLGVLYDLDKQIKTIERYIRRLEFHMSKVDELYEAYCIQRRLREGACKMKQAFASSPSSKAARESLSEINKSFKEYTENMCTVESEMENLLGEFCIKMKGLAGFARLCPGDQYEIFMRYGRQRWKLKGKIEVNGKQSWDGDEMFFLPLVSSLISIKVTELKGIASHILVGSVTCETKDLFAARPQAVAVDINDLGTVKLNLEVTWCPFDTEDLTPSTGNINKAAALQRRVSIYSQGTPETPTFKDHSFFKWFNPPQDRLRLSIMDALQETFFDKLRRSRSFSDLPSLRLRPRSGRERYSNMQDDVFDSGVESIEKRALSLSFDDLPNGDCTPPRSTPSSSLGYSNPEIMVTPPEHNLSELSSEEPVKDRLSASEYSASPSQHFQSIVERASETEETSTGDESDLSACQSHLSTVDSNIYITSNVSVSILQDSEEASELKPVELDACEGNLTKQLVKRLTSTEIPTVPERLQSDCSTYSEAEVSRSYLDGTLEESLQGLLLTLEPCKDQYQEYQELYHEITHLEDVLKCKPSVNRSRSSSISLTVESALESFDFLDTSDFDDEDGGGMVCNGGGADSVFTDSVVEKTSYRSEHPEARGHLSEALTEDTGVGTSVASSPLPLTTGNESLDITLVRHLQYCSELIKQIITSSQVLFVLRDLKKKLSRQSQVIKQLSDISKDNMGNTNSVVEVISGFHDMPSLLSFWTKCSTPVHMYHISADKMMKPLHETFSQMVNTESPGLAETVYRTLVAHILDKTENTLSSNLSAETITVFQYYDFFSGHNITDLKSYLMYLAKEASSEPVLQASMDTGKMTDLPHSEEILTSLNLLLSESDSDVSQALDLLSSAAFKSKEFRKEALTYFCEILTQPKVHLQKAAGLALGCLRATESNNILVAICQSDNKEISKVASETLLSLEDGRQAFEILRKTTLEDGRQAYVCLEKATTEGQDGRQAYEYLEKVIPVGEDTRQAYKCLEKAITEGEDGSQGHQCLEKAAPEGEDGRQGHQCLEKAAPEGEDGRHGHQCLEKAALEGEDGSQGHQCLEKAAPEGEDGRQGHQGLEKAALEGEDGSQGHQCLEKAAPEGEDGRHGHQCLEKAAPEGEDGRQGHQYLEKAAPEGEDERQGHQCLAKVTPETDERKQEYKCLGKAAPEVATLEEHRVPATATAF
ncbi:rho family-interacting cell polarization regulator 2 isoform X2 [Rhinoderma darwinii]|uniref:rho family-interacting cell polarization regulator 2 isoform X2 n=1 Tax=Rhinoderma darwinii TaxID=43563 RepID=UPI003F66D1AB